MRRRILKFKNFNLKYSSRRRPTGRGQCPSSLFR